jgi:hypothetical protein
MSRIDQVLANYNNFAQNQELTTNIFNTEQENAKEEEDKESIDALNEGYMQNLGMLGMHFFGDKIKQFLADKLGVDKEDVDEALNIAKNPKKAIDNLAESAKNKAKEELQKAKSNVEDEINERGLNPEGVLERTKLATNEQVKNIKDKVKRQLEDEDEEGAEPEEQQQMRTPGQGEPVEPQEPAQVEPEEDNEPMEDDEPDAEPLEPVEPPAAQALEPPAMQTPQSIVDNANDIEGFQSAAQSLRNMAEDSVGLPRGALNNASSESIARNLERYGDPERQDLADNFRQLQTKFKSYQEQQEQVRQELEDDPRPPQGMQTFDIDESNVKPPEPAPPEPEPTMPEPDIAADSSEFTMSGDAADLLLL